MRLLRHIDVGGHSNRSRTVGGHASEVTGYRQQLTLYLLARQDGARIERAMNLSSSGSPQTCSERLLGCTNTPFLTTRLTIGPGSILGYRWANLRRTSTYSDRICSLMRRSIRPSFQ